MPDRRSRVPSVGQECPLPAASPIPVQYAESFRCIGSACEDTCCQGWSVPIDQAAFEKYQSLPSSPLRTPVDASLLAMPEPASPATFAKIQMNGSNQCPLLTADRLCSIQAELGEGFLSHACATYPRIHQSIGGIRQTALSLSCPEAARLVLLSPNLLSPEQLAAIESCLFVASSCRWFAIAPTRSGKGSFCWEFFAAGWTPSPRATSRAAFPGFSPTSRPPLPPELCCPPWKPCP